MEGEPHPGSDEPKVHLVAFYPDVEFDYCAEQLDDAAITVLYDDLLLELQVQCPGLEFEKLEALAREAIFQLVAQVNEALKQTGGLTEIASIPLSAYATFGETGASG